MRYYVFVSDGVIKINCEEISTEKIIKGFNFICFREINDIPENFSKEIKEKGNCVLYIFENMLETENKDILFLSKKDIGLVLNGCCHINCFYDHSFYDIFYDISLYNLDWFFERLELLRKDIFSVKNKNWFLLKQGKDSYYYISNSGVRRVNSVDDFIKGVYNFNINTVYYWKNFVWPFVVPFVKTAFEESRK